MTAALWVLLWLLSQQQNASTTIQGMVVRAGTTQPLSGEMVGLWPTTRTTLAGVDGRFIASLRSKILHQPTPRQRRPAAGAIVSR